MRLTPQQTYSRFRLFQAKIEQKYTPKVRGILTKQADEFLAYASRVGFNQAASKINDFYPAAPFIPVLNALHFECGGKMGNDVYNQFKAVKSITTTRDNTIHYKGGITVIKPGAFNTPTQQIGNRVVSILKLSLVNNVHGITQSAKETTLQYIQEGANEGWGYDKTAGKIRDDIGSQWRAQRIVRTESVKASNIGAMEGAKATGLKMQKTWMSAKDDRVRGKPGGKYENAQFSHWDANGQVQPLERPFWVGEELMQPGDPSASVANIVNCRCSVAFKPIRDPITGRPVRVQTGSEIRQRQTTTT